MLTIALVVAAVLVGGSVFSFVTVRKSFPDTTGEVRITGLHGDVVIKRDAWGVPQVYAADERDLFFAQGYVHAQDRFYEMDFRRHVTAGRLAELVGEDAVDTDEFVRTLGWRRVAQQEYEQLDANTRSLLQAYSRGVNSYIEGKSGSELSLEYAILSLKGSEYRPEPWSPVDSVAWVKAMAWDLRSNMSDEIDRSLMAQHMPRAMVEQLYPDAPRLHRPIVGTDALKKASQAAEEIPTLLGIEDGIGSNSWVVDGRHSTTGRPILANDPHLAPSMPGIWYQVGLHCRRVSKGCPYDVSGFSFSGMPGVVVGHNGRVAWGVTTMYADAADLYLEDVEGGTYRYKGKRLPLVTRKEKIKVSGGETRTITVRSTRHGPILSDVDDDIEDVGQRYEVSLRWTALTPRPTISAVFALDRARDWDDFRAAAKLFTVPSQNLVYADVDGNIGYQAPGAIPIRSRGDGRWPVAGWDGKHEWTGYIPFDELPHELNPDEGFVVTANNEVVDDEYPYLIGADFAPGYRSTRIRQLLKEKKQLSVADMTRIQMDAYSANAALLVPRLLRIPLGDRFAREGRDILRGWDYQQRPGSAAAAYFNAVWRNLLELTFHDELPKDQWPGGGERWFDVVRSILDRPNSHWWDNLATPAVVETRDDILTEALVQARDELTRRMSRDTDAWSWGRLHRLTLVNPTLGDSGVGLVNRIFNRGPVEVGGGGGLVDATAWDASDTTDPYAVTAVPSMRMVVDVGRFDRSRWINLTGASGHAYHEHYDDQLPLWADGRTLPWAFGAKAVDRGTEDVLTLRSASG
ncbi:penicillin acylase family protein [Aeromicrobium terrae]|uniref:Penicillin acylase family protein n=1 Tax=Aeromicrobium terrae TaxID=2498846 RepID=A0A5C8NMH4_9ACTN|nr:penicillin acylase family protein [Aeromicrobium terrae]